MQRKIFFVIGLYVLVGALLTAMPTYVTTVDNEVTVDAPVQSIIDGGPRSLTVEWYNFFDPGAGMCQDAWWTSESLYGDEHPLNWEFPQPMIAEDARYVQAPWGDMAGPYEGQGWSFFKTNARVKATGTNLPEINMTKGNSWDGSLMVGVGEFLPYNLLGDAPNGPSPSPGYAEIHWFATYINYTEFDPGREGWGYYDGWNYVLEGIYDGPQTGQKTFWSKVSTVVLDKNASMEVLGITETEWNTLIADVNAWWSTNEKFVEPAWRSWFIYEGQVRLDIWPFYGGWYLEDFKPYVSLVPSYNPTTEKLTFTIDYQAMGFECLLGRWFSEVDILHYEAYAYPDLYLDAYIGPTSANLTLDTGMTWVLDLVSPEPYSDMSAWAFENRKGDYIASAPPQHPHSDYDPYVGKEPIPPIRSIGHIKYNHTYDEEFYFIGNVWDLKDGETLIFNYATPEPVWALTREPGNASQMVYDPDAYYGVDPGIMVYGPFYNATAYLTPTRIEPYPADFPGQILVDETAKTVTFVGPINMTEWSKTTLTQYWNMLADENYPEGLLPWGCPYIEFTVDRKGAGDVNVDAFVNIFDLIGVRDHLATQREPYDPNYWPNADENNDGFVNIFDLLTVRDNLGKEYNYDP